jgi:nicotinamide phosphoribosyltransferase
MTLKSIILNTDSYISSHYLQYPNNMQEVSCYIESRGGKFEKILFFGLQIFLKEYLSEPITKENIIFGEKFLNSHGLVFNKAGWEYILEKHNGYLPIEIEAIPEGELIPNQNVMVQIRNTDPNCAWLPSYIETALLRAVWYPSTVATISWNAKKIIKKYMEITSDNFDGLLFKLHDFGARGVSSLESAAIGGAAHLVNFRGTDTISGVLAAKRYYNHDMAGYSIPASSHSTITSWGKNFEKEAYENILDIFLKERKTVAIVSDSYDLWHALDNIFGEKLKEKIIHSKGTLVIRPDSGEPNLVVLRAINILMDKFGYSLNKKGYRVLPSYLRLIHGDRISLDTIELTLQTLEQNCISADNISFGMGGELLQKCNRDTLMFAMKTSAIKIKEEWIDVYKDPVTDSNKKSKSGRLALIKEDSLYKTIRQDQLANKDNLLKPVFRDGKLLVDYNFEDIRELTEQVL